jgi:hypothetical protein
MANAEFCAPACEEGAVDAVIHMGDHAYDLAWAGDRHGDAYMNAFEPTIASCPWLPIIGNHEADDGDHYQHYAAMAWGEEFGLSGNQNFPAADQHRGAESVSTATSALGRFLTKHTMYAMSSHVRMILSSTCQLNLTLIVHLTVLVVTCSHRSETQMVDAIIVARIAVRFNDNCPTRRIWIVTGRHTVEFVPFHVDGHRATPRGCARPKQPGRCTDGLAAGGPEGSKRTSSPRGKAVDYGHVSLSTCTLCDRRALESLACTLPWEPGANR